MPNIISQYAHDQFNAARLLLERTHKTNNTIVMHYGSPTDSPISNYTLALKNQCFNPEELERCVKKYGHPKGSPALRQAISHWYQKYYNLSIDPENEILVTNGSTEALTLSVLSTTKPYDIVATSNPSYSLFKNLIKDLDRKTLEIIRKPGEDEYLNISSNVNLKTAKCFIINSPENPTGYVLSRQDWDEVAHAAEKNNIYIIHDEVSGILDLSGQHILARQIPKLCQKSILINGFSKMFGMPGIKIGWIIANENVIKSASKYHNHLYLGTNPISEQISLHVLKNKTTDTWLSKWKNTLKERRNVLLKELTAKHGYLWPRKPLGGFSFTPNVSELYKVIPNSYKQQQLTQGEIVAEYLFQEHGVSVMPGKIYGNQLNEYIKIVTCNSEKEFFEGVSRLQCIH